MIDPIVASIVSAVTSGSVVSFITFLITRHDKQRDKDTAQSRMLKGLGHDRIMYLGESYIGRGYITADEYENLHDYLYSPYKELGGNGTAEKIMNEVNKLPVHK